MAYVRYLKLNDIVDQIFPSTTSKLVADFNDWNYWKPTVDDIQLPPLNSSPIVSDGLKLTKPVPSLEILSSIPNPLKQELSDDDSSYDEEDFEEEEI